MASQGSSAAESYASGINQSTCQVVISDPYLTGAAWPALFDAASMWSASNTAQTNNIILPPCGENQDPVKDKCFRYASIDDSALINSDGSSRPLQDTFAHIIISFWYEVNGTAFGSDYYFRVNRISVNHGSNFPSVTLSGTDPKAVVFNQNLINVKFDEGISVEEALKKISEENGYRADFCVPPNQDTASTYILPRSIIYKGVTPDEAMKKLVAATGGSMLSLPVKEYGNRVSICTRGEITQSCMVFYLGKGLYETFQIDGEPPVTFAGQNMQSGATINNGDPYLSASFAASKYSLKEVIKQKRIKALQDVKKVTFPDLFKPCEKRCQGPQADGYGWSGQGPLVENKRYTKAGMYGLAPNGLTSISYLPGVVESASESEGKVVIKTEFWFQICKEDDSQKCFGRYIYQESTNLSSVKVKNREEVKISQEIGSSTSAKKELVRFYINGHSNETVTIDPQLIWNWAAPAETTSDFQNKNAPTGPSNAIVQPAPKQSLKDWKATTTAKPSKILLMAGHADLTSSGAADEYKLNIELVKWAGRNAQAYGISDLIETYLPPSSNLTDTDPRSQFSKTTQAIAAGKQVIEIHNDQTDGKSGVIPPTGGKRIWPLDEALSSSYGAFSVNHRDGLGVPKRGGTILEVGRMDPPVRNIVHSGTTAQKEALYKQLMDPLMRSIASEMGKTPTTSAPTTNQSGQQGSVFVGKVGSTGRSSAPHVHFQFAGGSGQGSEAKLTEIARKYVIAGNKPLGDAERNQGYGAGRNHQGIDFFPGNRSNIYITNGASVKQVNETKCVRENSLSDQCGGGFGNYVTIGTPEGDVIMAHLAPESIPPNLPGLTSSDSGGNTSPSIAGAPANKALTIETSFKGVPRALRITPGRTILSFITDYDNWVENGGPRGQDPSTDPGVWIPSRFRNWFVGEVQFMWRQGDLRVDIEANNAWGNSVISAPTFSEYLQGQQSTGEFNVTRDYYGYIRSVGDLCFPVKKSDTGEYTSSCKELCRESQEFYRKYGSGGGQETGGNGGSTSSFPAANCKTGDATKDTIISALYAAGLKTPNAFAGALGNLQEESGFDPNVHNTSRQGLTCRSVSGQKEKCYGIVQWGGSRKSQVLSKCGQNSTLQCQLEFMVQEIKTRGGGLVESMNSSGSASAAADLWMSKYEVASGGGRRRQQYAEQIVKTMKCDR